MPSPVSRSRRHAVLPQRKLSRARITRYLDIGPPGGPCTLFCIGSCSGFRCARRDLLLRPLAFHSQFTSTEDVIGDCATAGIVFRWERNGLVICPNRRRLAARIASARARSRSTGAVAFSSRRNRFMIAFMLIPGSSSGTTCQQLFHFPFTQ